MRLIHALFLTAALTTLGLIGGAPLGLALACGALFSAAAFVASHTVPLIPVPYFRTHWYAPPIVTMGSRRIARPVAHPHVRPHIHPHVSAPIHSQPSRGFFNLFSGSGRPSGSFVGSSAP